jgi:hypothetical protein
MTPPTSLNEVAPTVNRNDITDKPQQGGANGKLKQHHQ